MMMIMMMKRVKKNLRKVKKMIVQIWKKVQVLNMMES